MKSYDCRVLVCSGTGCIATGSNKIHQLFQELIADDPAIDLQFAPHDAAEHDGPKRQRQPAAGLEIMGFQQNFRLDAA